MLKTDKAFVMANYMDYVARSAKEYKSQLRDLYLYSTNHERWKSHTFHHPSTFDTLAMDPVAKSRLMADLTAYQQGEAYFKKVGRAWKRGYLLYGPPGTGKSSLIAAMANRLRYNIYDLELTEVYDNSQLKMLLTHTTSKSIIVIEDIDCSLDLTGSRVEKQEKGKTTSGKGRHGSKQGSSGGNSNNTSKVTLSGLLNFTDGLWSCLGNERIIVFTTNHIEKLDPGLLRPGRMDMHIHMSFCNFDVFKVLAMNYLSLSSDPLFEKIEQLLKEENVRITPAEVTEFLFEHKNNNELALQTLVEDLVRRTVEGDSVDEADAKDGSGEVELESEEVAAELASRDQNDEEDVDEKPCTRVHCNVASHAGQLDWFKIYVDYKQKVQRQGGLGKRQPTRSRTSRY
ncbi:hypothetical protein M758_6G171800 [Ceratodon purpureus]|nr:hypothetical protein M758_6G171800 [Ceratodon purpureus]